MVVDDSSIAKQGAVRRITRRRGACNRCRARKVRCDGKSLCSECQRLGFDCTYVPTHRSRPSMDHHEMLSETPISQQIESPFDTTPSSESSLSFLESEYLGDIFALDTVPYSTGNLGPAEFLDMNAIPSDGTSDTIIPACPNLFNRKGHFAFNENLPVDLKIPLSTQLLPNSYSSPKLGYSLTMTSPGSQYMPEVNDANPFNACIFKVKARQNSLIKDTILEGIQQHCNQRRLGKKDHLLQTLERLMTQNVKIYPPGILGCLETNVDDFSIHRKFVFDCIDVCLSDQLGVSAFLDRASLEIAVHEALSQMQCSTAAKALVHIILALGTHLLHCEGRCESLPELQYNPLLHFNAALKLKEQLMDDAFSVMRLQALVTMAYFGLLLQSKETRCLLSNCIQYSQTMRLNRSSSINVLCATLDDRRRVKKAFWFLYIMEQRFCLQTETFPLLNHDFVDHEPPKAEEHSVPVDWLSIYCHHASICAFILQEFYGQRALQSQDPSYISNLEEQLFKWMQRLPSELQLLDGRLVGLSMMRSQERRIKLHIFCLYYEILLAVYVKQTFTKSLAVTDINMWPSYNDQQQSSAVKKLLEASHQFTVADVRLDLSFYQLVRVASCKLAVSTIRDGNDSKDLSYLSMAVGFFGRMAIGDIDGPQEEVTEIAKIVRQLTKENHGIQ